MKKIALLMSLILVFSMSFVLAVDIAAAPSNNLSGESGEILNNDQDMIISGETETISGENEEEILSGKML